MNGLPESVIAAATGFVTTSPQSQQWLKPSPLLLALRLVTE
ncbi:MAG: hypothetical protein U0792_21735 [Gemmataceae bacterium]